jgi:hypothetical protein
MSVELPTSRIGEVVSAVPSLPVELFVEPPPEEVPLAPPLPVPVELSPLEDAAVVVPLRVELKPELPAGAAWQAVTSKKGSREREPIQGRVARIRSEVHMPRL